MNKLIASAGLVAVGTASLHAAAESYGLSRQEASKPWSIAASLRGFYDDNVVAAPKRFEEDSYGMEFSPAFALNFPMEQTYVKLSYIYSLKYYFDRKGDDADHSHDFEIKAEHRFSERYRVELADSFVYSQEPEVLDARSQTTFRTEADAFRNRAGINFIAQVTELVSVLAGYQNLWYDFKQDGAGSRSALLDRMEHLFRLDGRYQVQENLMALIGYQYGIVDYTSEDSIDVANPAGPPGDIRDSTSHYLYLGANHAFSSQFNGEIRVGGQYTEYDELDEDSLNPYVDLSGTYTYNPGSYVQIGFSHTRNATDVGGTGTDLTLDQETSSVYGAINHRITPHFTGSILARYQHGVFNGGPSDDDVDNFFFAGLNLEYRINNNWAAEIGYNYDRLDSDDTTNRSYTRNRVYLGVRANY